MHGTIKKRQRIRAFDLEQMPPEELYSPETFEIVDAARALKARSDFWLYRQYINGKAMKLGWWQELIAAEFQRFYTDLLAGLRPKLVLESPPQHGKTKQVTDFVSFVAGNLPDFKTIFASYSDDLGIRTNSDLQKIIDGRAFKNVFPGTAMSMGNVVEGHGRPKRNSFLLEWVGHQGSFRNTTVDGQVTGQGLDLGLIDDPIKGRAEAQNKHLRDKVWAWLTDDFMTRMADHAGLIFSMTRWHVDDPVARFLAHFPETRVIRFPAIAEHDEYLGRHLLRSKGDPLFPEHKSLEFLLTQKRGMTLAGWESLYQQNPIIVGGDVFPIDKIEILPDMPDVALIRKSIRYWDKAGTQGGGAFTAGVLMHAMKDGTYIISDVEHGQWSAINREKTIKECAERDQENYERVHIFVEQEPGSGGKESAERTIANLSGFPVFADRVTGKKEIRAEPFAAQVQGGNVKVIQAKWNKSYFEELEAFPNAKYKDRTDASSGAFNKLSSAGYDRSMSWV